MIEGKMVGWHHWLNEHEFAKASGDGEGHGSLAFFSACSYKESDTTGWLNNKNECNFWVLQYQHIEADLKTKSGSLETQAFNH